VEWFSVFIWVPFFYILSWRELQRLQTITVRNTCTISAYVSVHCIPLLMLVYNIGASAAVAFAILNPDAQMCVVVSAM
jgi:hypothetical protein